MLGSDKSTHMMNSRVLRAGYNMGKSEGKGLQQNMYYCSTPSMEIMAVALFYCNQNKSKQRGRANTLLISSFLVSCRSAVFSFVKLVK